MSPKPPKNPPSASTPASGFWKHKTFSELAAEQGVKPWTAETSAKMQELANELWPTDEDVNEFIAWVREIRGKPPLPRPTAVP